jgi:hypothetical protein
MKVFRVVFHTGEYSGRYCRTVVTYKDYESAVDHATEACAALGGAWNRDFGWDEREAMADANPWAPGFTPDYTGANFTVETIEVRGGKARPMKGTA